MSKLDMELYERNFLLENGQLMVIGARPSIGKSILIQNIVQKLFLFKNISIGYFSHMRKPLLIEKMVKCQRMISSSEFVYANDDNSTSNIVIDDTPQITMDELASSIEAMINKDNIQYLVIDGIDNIYIKNTNIDELISKVLPYLKKLALDLNIPIVISIGLNSNLENRSNKYPVLTDFDNYRAVEQNASVIVYLYRDEVYDENSHFKGLAHVRFENVDGRNNITNLMMFDGENSCFKHYIHPIYAE